MPAGIDSALAAPVIVAGALSRLASAARPRRSGAAAGKVAAEAPVYTVKCPTVTEADGVRPAGEPTHGDPKLAAALNRAEQLEVALRSSRQIGMAMGIVMERHRLTEGRAFEYLKELSSRRNVKLRAIAEEIVHTGESPVPSAGPAS